MLFYGKYENGQRYICAYDEEKHGAPRVDNLQYRATGKESWEQSQYFWYNGKKTCELYNTETGEIKWFDASGKEVLLFERG